MHDELTHWLVVFGLAASMGAIYGYMGARSEETAAYLAPAAVSSGVASPVAPDGPPVPGTAESAPAPPLSLTEAR